MSFGEGFSRNSGIVKHMLMFFILGNKENIFICIHFLFEMECVKRSFDNKVIYLELQSGGFYLAVFEQSRS